MTHSRLAVALAALVLAGLLSAFGPYADIRSRMAPRSPFEEAPAASPDDMTAALDRIGPDGRAAYARQLGWDVVVIAANGAWLWIWLRAAARRVLLKPAAAVLPASLAVLVIVADLAENVALGLSLGAYPAVAPWHVGLSGAATQAKLACFGLALVTALALSLAWGGRSLASRMKRVSAATQS